MKILTVFDDMIADMFSKKNFQYSPNYLLEVEN